MGNQFAPLTPEERECLEAHKAYVAAMRTVEGPTDADAQRLEKAKQAYYSANADDGSRDSSPEVTK